MEPRSDPRSDPAAEVVDVAVIGAGFSGLGTAAALRARGVGRFVVLERGACAGHFWTRTYDRLHLHSAWHDMPDDGGASRRYPMFKSRDQVVRYLGEYAERHGLQPHLRLGVEVRHVRQLGEGQGERADWLLETSAGPLRARFLAIATAINRAPWEPELTGRERYRGRLEHSSAWRSAQGSAGKRVLVVGSGNSAAEIALDLAEHGAIPSMWVRGPRHFLRLRSMARLYRTMRLLGQAAPAKMDARHRVTFGTPEFERAVDGFDRILTWLSVDLSRYGIRKPTDSVGRETFWKGRIPVYDVGTIAMIRKGRIRVVDGNERPIEAFTETGVRFGDGDERFDGVVLATGFRPKLEEFLAEPRMLGRVRWMEQGPLTNLRSRSTVFPSAFFPGFDVSPIGGLSLGRWGWEAGEEIARALAGASHAGLDVVPPSAPPSVAAG